MALLQTVHLEHLPSNYVVHIALYRNITNATFLQQQLLAGNTDFEYALIDASVIVSKIHILAAAYRAVNDLLEDRLRSRNVHSEMIATSFRTFGITPQTTSLLILKLTTPSSPLTAESIASHLTAQIQGEAMPFEDEELEVLCDEEKVRKVYKLNGTVPGKGRGESNGVANGVDGQQSKRKDLEVLVLGAMALRGQGN